MRLHATLVDKLCAIGGQARTSAAKSAHPTNTDPAAWRAHWRDLGQPWRTEPEIDEKRKEELASRRATIHDPVQSVYPFKDVKLNRADVEWLLETHEGGRGPVDLSNEQQRNRWGLDLRGAVLRDTDLSGLPLAHLRAGSEYDPPIHLEG